MKISDTTLGFIGFGHLAHVIFQAIDSAKLIPRSHILFLQRDTHKMRANEEKYGITSASLETLVKKSQVLLLAVRPNQAEAVLRQLADIGVAGKQVITVIAGLKFAFYQKYLGKNVELLRTMPNLASSVKEGMTVLSYAPDCSLEFKSYGNLFFKSMGEIVELDESLMNISVGVSGSGPGFVFRLIEAMARAGEAGGIPYEKSLMMSAQTFLGAAKLIQMGHEPQKLVVQIAVPNGTTEAGFRVMKEREIEKHFQEAVDAATRRSKEISEEFR